MWVFILLDVFIFSIFFVVFMYYRAHDVEGFSASQSFLNVNYGVFNTLILLTSSWCAVITLKCVRVGLIRYAKLFIVLAICFGICFGLSKVIEYNEKFSQGIGLTTDDFFMYYFLFTGMHLLHVIIGIIVLVYLWISMSDIDVGVLDIEMIEGGTAYWHMVDFLWILIFTLLYLLR